MASSTPSNAGQDADQILPAFLHFLEKQMVNHRHLIEPADRNQLARICNLVEGVSADQIFIQLR